MSRQTLILGLFGLAAITAVVGLALTEHAGWDFDVYWQASQAVGQGSDPYAEGIAAQERFHALPAEDKRVAPPMTYVYPPMTLPLLRVGALLRREVAESLFFAALIAGFALQLWAGWQMADGEERRWLRWLLPAVAFFPGLMNDDVLLSGNIAYLLYGLILGSAVLGWKRNRWGLYCAAVLFASCFKAPLLSLLAFPVVVDKRQWRLASLAGAAGLILFLVQARLWPGMFREYLAAVKLQFNFNHDFGMAPSGVLGYALFEAGLPFSFATSALYLVFAGAVFSVLLWTGRWIGKNPDLRERWLPVAFIGTVLLNPRVKEYDVASLTVPMVLVGSRLLQMLMRRRSGELHRIGPGPSGFSRESLAGALLAGGWFLAANVGATGDTWKPIELSLLVVAFAAGTWWSWRQSRLPLAGRAAGRLLHPVQQTAPRRRLAVVGGVARQEVRP